MLTFVGLRQLTAETRPLTSNDLNTLVQGVRAAQVRLATSGRMLSTKMLFLILSRLAACIRPLRLKPQ